MCCTSVSFLYVQPCSDEYETLYQVPSKAIFQKDLTVRGGLFQLQALICFRRRQDIANSFSLRFCIALG
jgi:hypothetical protein